MFIVAHLGWRRMVHAMQIGKAVKCRGYTYIGLLIIVMLTGFALAQAGTTWSEKVRRSREQELLKIGDKLRIAIGQYYENSPSTIKQFPQSLGDLLFDKRFPTPKRYLREVYIDPFTGRRDWGMLIASDGGIMGVYSLSGLKPYKRANFRPRYQYFADKKTYGDWIFAYIPSENLTSPLSKGH